MFSNISRTLENKNILILGFGREGKSTLSFLKKHVKCKSITIADLNEIPGDYEEKIITGKDYQRGIEEYDVIIKSPGIVYENPTSDIVRKTTSQTTLFLSEFRDRTIGITGTKGKSTTTTLIHHILSSCGVNAILGGNIGIPPLDIAENMDKDSVAVLEMSCHQLEYEIFSPHIAVILNLYEDHLDHYITRDNYVMAKRNIYKNQVDTDLFICNSECEFEIEEARARVVTVGNGAHASLGEHCFSYNNQKIEIEEGKGGLFGAHNLFNIATAFSVASIFNISVSDFLKALDSYRPLPHRLEFVKRINDVDFYDDSISTVPQTTIRAVSTFDNVSTVIIGGMDRGIDYTELVDFFKSNPIDNIILMYESGKRISHLFDKASIKYRYVETLEMAVELAVRVSPPNTRCIMSPASASYGDFKNFEHRGEMFSKYLDKYRDLKTN